MNHSREIFLFFILCFIGTSLQVHAELTEEQKQALFLQTKTNSKKKAAAHSSSSHKKHHSSSTSKTKSPSHHTVAPSSDTSHDTIIPINSTPSQQASARCPITIEKSGILPDQGLEPLPAPLPHSTHGWWIFEHDDTPASAYHYVTPAIRRAIDRAPVRHGRWKYIIVHNSGTRSGNARIFDIYHRRVRHMVNGLAYHFVIGDGHDSGNGEIEIGHRWTAQINGGHVASDYLNDISLGICLVGDYNRDLPTKAQIIALNELISYLRLRVGKTQGHQAIVCAHKEINPRPTDCPGSRFPYHWLHQTFKDGR